VRREKATNEQIRLKLTGWNLISKGIPVKSGKVERRAAIDPATLRSMRSRPDNSHILIHRSRLTNFEFEV
jgi:hypothetical protein